MTDRVISAMHCCVRRPTWLVGRPRPMRPKVPAFGGSFTPGSSAGGNCPHLLSGLLRSIGLAFDEACNLPAQPAPACAAELFRQQQEHGRKRDRSYLLLHVPAYRQPCRGTLLRCHRSAWSVKQFTASERRTLQAAHGCLAGVAGQASGLNSTGDSDANSARSRTGVAKRTNDAGTAARSVGHRDWRQWRADAAAERSVSSA